MAQTNQVGNISKIEKDNYRKNLVILDVQPKTHFWKNKLADYDEDATLGTTKEERLAKNQNITFGPILAKKRKIQSTSEKRKKLKSVVIKPQSTPIQKSTSTDAPKEKYWLETFLKDTAHKYGDLDYKVPEALPPTYSKSHPDATNLTQTDKKKLDEITARKISAQEKRHLLIESQNKIMPNIDDYDFHDFDIKKLDEIDYGDLGFDC